jgi:ribosome biogenesis GTPase A
MYLKFKIKGELNSGKSSFINLLLQDQILSTKNEPDTSTIYHLKYNDEKIFKIKKSEKYIILSNGS